MSSGTNVSLDPLQIANLWQKRSAEDFNQLSMICHSRQMLYESEVKATEQYWNKCVILVDNMRDKSQLLACTEWGLYCKARDSLERSKEAWQKAAGDQSSFSNNDDNGEKFHAVLTQSMHVDNDNSGSKRKAVESIPGTMFGTPTALSVSARSSQTPVSHMTLEIMDDGGHTSGDKNCCASSRFCRSPWVPVSNNHPCTVCRKSVHSWCFGENVEGGSSTCALCVDPQRICENAMNFTPPPRAS
jgi:hypothetical protein